MKKFFENAANDFEVPLNQKVGKLYDRISGAVSALHLHFLMMRNFLFWMSLHQDWTHYFEKIDEISAGNCEDGTRSYLCPRISQKIGSHRRYILLMKDGRIVWDLQIEEVRERYLIVYGTKEEIEQFRQGKSDLQVFLENTKIMHLSKKI